MGISCSWVPVEVILPLRHRVIIEGTGRTSDRFPGDDAPSTRHLAAMSGDDVVGCATFLRSPYEGREAWQLRGMAVDPSMQGQGVGREMLAFALPDLAAQSGISLFWCNARVSAVSFYERTGWKVVSDEFMTPGVGPHYRMRTEEIEHSP